MASHLGCGVPNAYGGWGVGGRRRVVRGRCPAEEVAALLHDRIDQALGSTDRDLGPAALLLIDLDRFMEINDTFGHHYATCC